MEININQLTNETHLILGDLHTDVEELTVCLYISVVAASDLVLAGEGRVRQIVRTEVGRSHLAPRTLQQ